MNESESSAAARDDLLAKVLALPPADREFIAERIDETLDREAGFSQSPFATPELAQAWANEVERRIDMIDKTMPARSSARSKAVRNTLASTPEIGEPWGTPTGSPGSGVAAGQSGHRACQYHARYPATVSAGEQEPLVTANLRAL